MSRENSHPLRGSIVIIGGLVAGFGVGLALNDPAAGLLGGAGLGMMLGGVLRAFGRW